MKHKLNKTDGIECVFIGDEGKEVTYFIPEHRIKKLIEEEAYEQVTKPECGCSSCAVNNFCECDPVNEDLELNHLVMNINKNDKESYSEIETLIIKWNIDGTKTAGSLTREIMELLKKDKDDRDN